MTLARTRLLLGISGVGATVVAAVAALWLDLPTRLFSSDPTAPLASTVAAALLGPVAWTVAMLPLDLVGGTVAVRRRPGRSAWVLGWCRGVLVQLLMLALSGTALVLAARQLDVAGTIAMAAAGALLVLARLDDLARLGAALRLRPTSGPQRRLDAAGLGETATIVAVHDEAFVGGYAGLFRSRLLVPASWFALPESVTNALLTRRRVAEGRPRRRGMLAACAWVALGAAVVALSLGAPTSTAGLVEFSAGMTLWSFLGVLVLPTPSRRAVLAVDAAAAQEVPHGAVREAIATLDRWQDDEPERDAWIETIFHPVPSRSVRERALVMGGTPTAGAWRVARLALPSALTSWSLLGRAVHCNLGRPALWWMLPGD
jgi:hypothetical protein